MAYTEKQKEEILNNIFEKIEEGISTRKAVVECGIPAKTFYQWIEADGEKSKQYARVKELGIEAKFDSIENDYSEEPQRDSETGKIDTGWVQLQRLKIDAKKWELSKLAPKKYGDKLELEQNGTISISWNEEKTYENKE